MFCCSCIYFFNYDLICVDILFSFLQAKHLPQRVRLNGTTSVSGQLPTYPSPNPKLTLTCYQLTFVELGEGQVGSCPVTDIDPIKHCLSHKGWGRNSLKKLIFYETIFQLMGRLQYYSIFFLTIKNCDKKIS